MSKRKWLLIVVIFSLLSLAAVGFTSSLALAPGPVIHENPADLTTQQAYDMNGRLTLQLEQMFGSLDNIMLRINAGDFNASRQSMRDFDQYYSLFKDSLNRMNLSGSDYQRILSQADITANDLRAMINSTESYNASMALFDQYWTNTDTVNATIEAVQLQDYYNAINSSSQNLTASASTLSKLLENFSVNTNQLDRGIDLLNAYTDKVEVQYEQPKKLLGSTNVTLNASLTDVSTGDIVIFFVRVSDNNATINEGRICLYVDNEPITDLMIGPDGMCTIYYSVRGGTFASTINAIAYYDPQGASYSSGVSNTVKLTRRSITPVLTIDMTPTIARFGDIVHIQGRLATDGGYPVPDHPVSISFPGRTACIARTSANGLYYYDLIVTPEVPSGQFDVQAAYDAGNVPGDALVSTASMPAMLCVIPEVSSLTLDPPPQILQGGDIITFTGTLTSASGLPAEGQTVNVSAGSRFLGSNVTGADGRYNLTVRIPCNMTAGDYPVYTAYDPPDGMALTGSRSNEYQITFRAAPPTVAVYGIPIIAFQGDMMDLLVNVTAKGTAVNGSDIVVNMSDLTIARGRTDDTGNFYLVTMINGSAGLQTIKVNNTGSGLLEGATVATGMVFIMPFDAVTSAVIVVIILSVLGLIIAWVTRARRVRSRLLTARKPALPRPSIKVTPMPELQKVPAKPAVTRFEDEIARIEAIVAGGGGNRDIIAEIYQAARRIAVTHGYAIPESATHREFYKHIVAKEPRLNVPTGTITKHYEAAVFGNRQLSEKDIVGSLFSLKEINTLAPGEPTGDHAPTGGGT